MSTSIAHEQESKQQDVYNGKDDQKQQAALSKKQSQTQSDAPVDSGSSLVGGTLAAVQNAVDRGIHMLPASLQDRALTLEEQAKLALHKAGELAAPVVESYQQDGIIAAAKTATQVTKETASAAASAAKQQLQQAKKDNKADLKADKKDGKADLKAKKDDVKQQLKDKKDELTSQLQSKKDELQPELQAKKEQLSAKKDEVAQQLSAKKDELSADLQAKKADIKAELKDAKADAKSELKANKQQLKGKKQQSKQAATGAIANLQQTATEAAANLQASAIQLKDQAIAAGMSLKERVLPSGEQGDAAAPKKHGRRRRGGRGHGNRKMKMRVLAEKEIETISHTLGDKAKEIQHILVDEPAAGSSNPGLVQNIRANVSNLAATASSTATGIVSGAQAKVNQLTGSAKQMLNESSKASNLERKPSLQRRDELPALGTPMSPDATVTETRDGKLAAKPADQSSLLDKAKFAVGGAVEATRDFVADKLDNISMNADDSKPLDKSDKTALKQAEAQLDNLKQAVSKQ